MKSQPGSLNEKQAGLRPDDAASTPAAAPASVGRPLKEIGWAFLGIRRRSGAVEGASRISPLLLIAVAFVALLVFVVILIVVVHAVVPR